MSKRTKPKRNVLKLTTAIEIEHKDSDTVTVVEELAFRAPKAKDMRRLDTREEHVMDSMLKLAGRLCGQPDHVIDELTGEDMEGVFKLVEGFMPGGRKTGSTRSRS